MQNTDAQIFPRITPALPFSENKGLWRLGRTVVISRGPFGWLGPRKSHPLISDVSNHRDFIRDIVLIEIQTCPTEMANDRSNDAT